MMVSRGFVIKGYSDSYLKPVDVVYILRYKTAGNNSW